MEVVLTQVVHEEFNDNLSKYPKEISRGKQNNDFFNKKNCICYNMKLKLLKEDFSKVDSFVGL